MEPGCAQIFVTILVAVFKIRIHIRPAMPKLQDASPTRVVSTWCRSLHKRLQPVLETMRPVLDTQGLEVHPLPACGVSLPCSWPVLCRWPWPAPGQQSVCVKGAAWRLKSELRSGPLSVCSELVSKLLRTLSAGSQNFGPEPKLQLYPHNCNFCSVLRTLGWGSEKLCPKF